MRKLALLVLPALVLVAAAYGGWYWWTNWRFLQSTDDAYVQSDVSLISPKVEGYIKEVRVQENEEVRAGQVLFVIDDRDFAAKKVQAEAAVATEEAMIETYESRLDLQRAMIDQANAEVASSIISATNNWRRAITRADNASRRRRPIMTRPPRRSLKSARRSPLRSAHCGCCACSVTKRRQNGSRPGRSCNWRRTTSTTP
jgi:multidrug resistance efflux pump